MEEWTQVTYGILLLYDKQKRPGTLFFNRLIHPSRMRPSLCYLLFYIMFLLFFILHYKCLFNVKKSQWKKESPCSKCGSWSQRLFIQCWKISHNTKLWERSFPKSEKCQYLNIFKHLTLPSNRYVLSYLTWERRSVETSTLLSSRLHAHWYLAIVVKKTIDVEWDCVYFIIPWLCNMPIDETRWCLARVIKKQQDIWSVNGEVSVFICT